MTKTMKPQRDSDIHFDADLLVKALRYHLEESGLSAGGLLSHLEGTAIETTIPRSTWAIFSDEQRLSWLLGVSRTGADGLSMKPAATRRPRTERQNI